MQKAKAEIVAEAIALLQHVRARPGMYIVPANSSTAHAFLNGLTLGLALAGVEFSDWWEVQAARGWREHASGPVPQMEERGMDEAAIVTELIDIALDQLRRAGPEPVP